MFRHPLPSAGSPRRGFPDFHGTMGCSDALPSVRPHFVPFAWPYHARVARFVYWPLRHSCRTATRVQQAGGFHAGCPDRPLTWRRQGLPGSWRTRMHMPCSLTPAGPATSGLLRRVGAAFRGHYGVGSRESKPFGALSHGLCTGCLRFAGGDCSPSTQDSLPAAGQALPDGIGYPSSPHARFSCLLHPTPPCPGFAWRTMSGL
jgi:hypothetical protein